MQQETVQQETETERQRRRESRARRMLAFWLAAAALLSGLNAALQVGRTAADYGCRHGWLGAECRTTVERR